MASQDHQSDTGNRVNEQQAELGQVVIGKQ